MAESINIYEACPGNKCTEAVMVKGIFFDM